MIIVYTDAGGVRAYARRDPGDQLAWDSDRAKAARFGDEASARAFLAPRNTIPVAFEEGP